MSGINELARMLKDRENPSIQGIGIGTVITATPELMIQFNGFILEKDRLKIAQHLLPTYKRNTSPMITVSGASVGDHGSHTHAVSITDITFTDTLQSGDEVIVIPSIDDATYFIIDKVGDV